MKYHLDNDDDFSMYFNPYLTILTHAFPSEVGYHDNYFFLLYIVAVRYSAEFKTELRKSPVVEIDFRVRSRCYVRSQMRPRHFNQYFWPNPLIFRNKGIFELEHCKYVGYVNSSPIFTAHSECYAKYDVVYRRKA
jgi:hypothetical protein